ncbi:MAG: hypothetical protein Q7R57_09330 [Dehalococcoidales bacterium]|nr:hypothetical protein [Dehalococcoidales bacterium]
MFAAIALIGLNLADALLSRADLRVGEIQFVSPMVPPFEANLVARGLAAVVVIILLYLLKKGGWLWWVNTMIIGLICWRYIGYMLANTNGLPG